MTFLEAALEILKREGRPLHFKDLTERAMSKKLLTFVGRTPELTMQTQLTAAVKKSPGNPFVRVKPGVFGLLRYPELSAQEREEERENERRGSRKDKEKEQNGASAESSARSGEGPPERRRRKGAASEAASDSSEREGRGRRRRRGGKGRGRADEEARPAGAAAKNGAPAEATEIENGEADESSDEPSIGIGGLSAEARAAALAETGVLEGDDEMSAMDDDADGDEIAEGGAEGSGQFDEASGDTASAVGRSELRGPAEQTGNDASDDDADLDDDDELGTEGAEEGSAFAGAEGGPSAAGGGEEAGGRRRRRRRRRRRGEPGFGPESRPAGGSDDPGRVGETPESSASAGGGPGSSPGSAGGETEGGTESSVSGDGEAGAPVRRILTPVDAAIEVLRGQAPGRGVHVRQIADTAVRRRLIHGEPNEAWRVIRTALAAEPKERLRSGARPRVRAAGSGLFALARRPPDAELERAEQVFADARRALRERTMAALERRIAELPAGAFEALARVLLQREGFGPTTFVKRVDGTIYVEALRGRGSRPSKCLIALRPGATSAGRRAIGELRAGIRARGQEEGVLMLGGRLADEALAEWRQAGPPLEIADGAALAETCVRHGVGVLTSTVSVDFVDGDFFAELAEG